jgi:hypothetical protein
MAIPTPSPTVTPGAGAGSPATAMLFPGSTDDTGVVEVMTGPGAQIAQPIFDLTFGSAYDPPPRGVLIIPSDFEAAGLPIYIPSSFLGSTGFSLLSGSMLLSGLTLQWRYVLTF